MKAITIKQPWATLIALGLKEFETRSWATKHRGQIAIHAGKSIDKEAYEDFSNDLKAVGIENIKQLPIGSVIATASLVECHKVIKEYPKQNTAEVAAFYIDGKEDDHTVRLTDKFYEVENKEIHLGFKDKLCCYKFLSGLLVTG